MSNNVAGLQNLVIPATETSSNVLSRAEFEDANLIGIKAPAVLPESVVIQVCNTEDGTFATLNNGSSDVAGPGAGKACEYDAFAFKFFKLLANGPVAEERIFEVTKVWNPW